MHARHAGLRKYGEVTHDGTQGMPRRVKVSLGSLALCVVICWLRRCAIAEALQLASFQGPQALELRTAEWQLLKGMLAKKEEAQHY